MEELTFFEKGLDAEVDTGEAEDEEVNDVEKEAAEFQKVNGKSHKVLDKSNIKIWSAQQSDDVRRLVHYMQIIRLTEIHGMQ